MSLIQHLYLFLETGLPTLPNCSICNSENITMIILMCLFNFPNNQTLLPLFSCRIGCCCLVVLEGNFYNKNKEKPLVSEVSV